jgi:hypothetical protein
LCPEDTNQLREETKGAARLTERRERLLLAFTIAVVLVAMAIGGAVLVALH